MTVIPRIVISFDLGRDDVDNLRWYIITNDIRNDKGIFISINSAVHSMVKCFLDDEVKPLREREQNG